MADAPPAAPVHPGGYPVVVFSHGHQGFAGNAHFLMRWMAAQGWVAIAPDHVGNTLRDTPSPLPAAIFHLRARDASAALDALSAAPLRDALAGPIRTDRALLVGHSAGAHTTWAAAGATYDADAVAARCAGPNPCREGTARPFRWASATHASWPSCPWRAPFDASGLARRGTGRWLCPCWP